MAEKSTLARPYAQAVFELAQSQRALPAWSEHLQRLALAVNDLNVRRLIVSPRVTDDQRVAIIAEVAGNRPGDKAVSLLRVLARNRRLGVLPEIAALYEKLRAEAERSMQAEVVSAFEITEEQKQRLAAALKKRLGREVSLTCRTDESLIGGAIVRAGDLVIDGSVTGKLGKLAVALSH
ncbi:MAG: F-type H+-transporting ATPase subunit delta [Gammaproteobacteria bacterium]|nr:MAG: F-type H+-transporting ATPase subunit delta [Gammaproteobacteria bacterium]TND02494.1 MAG: F-type H+-transporting ATPase subunit delta [Gammaproteobacteria bacterium]